ncbi:MAG: superoxide dismutase [Bacteroidota bacterium]
MHKKKWNRRKVIKVLSASSAMTFFNFSSLYSNDIKPFFVQKPLPYTADALEPCIDARTMDIHYSKHAASYCSNLNAAIQKSNIDFPNDLSLILNNVSVYPESIRNNGGGHYNHELFWSCMIPGGKELQDGLLKKNIISQFGSHDKFKSAFEEVAKTRFGSGWAWLYIDENKNLDIGSTPNQDNPLMDISSIKGHPLLCLDVWEHAYYLNYQNRRTDYIRQWWNIVNWDFVSDRYAQYLNN